MTLLKNKGVLWPGVQVNGGIFLYHTNTEQYYQGTKPGTHLYQKQNDKATVTAYSLYPCTWK